MSIFLEFSLPPFLSQITTRHFHNCSSPFRSQIKTQKPGVFIKKLLAVRWVTYWNLTKMRTHTECTGTCSLAISSVTSAGVHLWLLFHRGLMENPPSHSIRSRHLSSFSLFFLFLGISILRPEALPFFSSPVQLLADKHFVSQWEVVEKSLYTLLIEQILQKSWQRQHPDDKPSLRTAIGIWIHGTQKQPHYVDSLKNVRVSSSQYAHVTLILLSTWV